VVSSGKAPAAGAQVFATTQRSVPPFDAETLAHAEAGSDGRFVLTLPESWVAKPVAKHLALWAWSPHHALTAQGFDGADIPVGKSIELSLAQAAGQSLKVLDASGQLVADASVAPIYVDLGSSQDSLPSELIELLVAHANADGVVAIDAWPLAQIRKWRVESRANGIQEIQDFQNHPPDWAAGELKLAPVAQLAVKVEQEGTDDVPTATIRAQTYVVDASAPTGRSTMGRARGTIGKGRTELGPIVAGGSLIEIDCDPDSPIRPVLWPATLEAGKAAECVIRWKPGLLVTGRVLERGSGTPIANARLCWFQYPCGRRELVTDAEGRFHVYAFPGSVGIEDVSAPAPHLGVHDFGVFRYTIEEGVKEKVLPDIELVRGVPLRGTVSDADGKPVPGAWIAAKWMGSSSNRVENEITTVADDHGAYVLDPVAPSVALEVTARAGGASTPKPLKFDSAGTGSLELKLESRSLVSMKGRVVDEGGRPVAGATVETWRASPENTIGGERQVGAVTSTGPDGRFETPRELVPGESFAVRVSAPGKVVERTAWVRANSEDALEIALRALAVVAGSLREADGTPVVGARVAVCGDAPAPVESATDAQGRFRLEGLLPGKVFLLFEHRGRVSGKVADPSAGSLDWKLDAAEAPLRTLPAAAPRERELEIARSLVDPRVKKAVDDKKPDDVYLALRDAAWAAPSLALAQVEAGALDGWRADFVRGAAVQALQVDRPDDALAVSGLVQGAYSRAWGSLKMAESAPESARQRKIELLADAAVRAQEVQDPAQRLTVLVRVAENLLALGEEKTARSIVDRITPIAESLPREEWAGYARGRFAELLARFDLARALMIVEGLKDSFERVRHRGNIAHKIASTQPEAAERTLNTQGRQDFEWERWVPRVCHDMATIDRERAVGIAERTAIMGKAQALGAIALAIAKTDPKAAAKLLDEAIAALRNQASFGQRMEAPAVAASLLPIVEHIDPSRVREFLWLAVSLREPRPVRDALSRDQEPFAADAQLALLVARYDRDLARALLVPLVERLKLGDPHRYGDWATQPLAAAIAVTDPEWALSLANTTLPERATATIIAVLARSGEERWRYVQDEYLNLWIVGKEDL